MNKEKIIIILIVVMIVTLIVFTWTAQFYKADGIRKTPLRILGLFFATIGWLATVVYYKSIHEEKEMLRLKDVRN